MSNILRSIVWNALIIILIISISYTPGYSSSAIQLEKEVVIDSPAIGVANLPDQMTFKIYDSDTSAMPIDYQSFYRGEYSAYYNIAKSDGITQKSIVRFSVEFTNLSQFGSNVDALKGTGNLWFEVELDGRPAAEREPLDKEITKQILSAVAAQNTIRPDTPQKVTKQVSGSDGQIQYNNGGVEGGASQFYYDETLKNVGIGTASPGYPFEIKAGSASAFLQPVYNTEVRFGSSSHPFALYSGGTERMRLDISGNIGIGTTNPCADCKLAVNGKIRAKQVVVDTGWSDFVFRDNYTLMSLQKLERFIRDNHHLPGIPTEADVKENGVSVGDISAKLLQKVEELTLYVIELKKENEALQKQFEKWAK